MADAAPDARVFITADELLRDSMSLGMQVLRSGFRPSFLVAIWRGGAPIGISVQEVLEYHGADCDHVAIRTSSYLAPGEQAPDVRVHGIDFLVSRLAAEDALLIVDDVFDSGRSVQALLEVLRQRCRRNLPQSIRVATVYYKPSRNKTALAPDYYVRTTDAWLVFPHELQGLTRAEIIAHKGVDEGFFEL